MTQKDMETIVSDIHQLNGVVVVTLPECLLYSAWQRSGQEWDPEAAGAYLGQVLHSNNRGLRAVDRDSTLDQITLEVDSSLIIVRPAQDYQFAVAYLFEKETPLGWARLQIQRTQDDIDRSLGKTKDDSTTAKKPDSGGKDESKPTASTPASSSSGSGAGASTAKPATPASSPGSSAPGSSAPGSSAPGSSAPGSSAPGSSAPSSAAASAASATPSSSSSSPATSSSSPSSSPSGGARSPSSATPSAAAPGSPARPSSPSSPATSPAASARSGSGSANASAPSGTAAKAVKLMKFLEERTPDTHAALMRVSLQTGLSLNRLNSPEGLSDEEYARVEESVRRILGVDSI